MALDRAPLIERYRKNRRRTAWLFALVHDDAIYERPIPLRHPFVFYQGHVPAFSFLTLNVRGLGEESLDPALERLFERGIDPGSLDDAHRHERADWPSRAAVAAFAARCDERVMRALAQAPIENPGVPRLVRAQAAYTILEHEAMHQETSAYIMHRLAYDRKGTMASQHDDPAYVPSGFQPVGAGIATLGAAPDDVAFGWDNEFGPTEIEVREFAIAQHPVTNGEWLAFVEDGGPVPEFWLERGGDRRLRLQFEEIALPRSWPVYVTHQQARAYASWKNMALPTEAQYHRAAFGTPSGTERPFPWGDDAPSARHGNFGFERFDPEPVTAHPAGTSAWGVADLVGNGWEWTSTPFAPLPGFEPMASYPQYSADFFDGRHFVLKGASPVTSRELIRRSMRNWFFDDYPYMYAKFRCVTT